MANRTLTRADLYHVVYLTVPRLSHIDAKDIVEATLDTLCESLVAGNSVRLRGFGTFNLRSKRPRVGRNPKTGCEHLITARRVMTFRPSPRLIAAVNGEAVGPADEADDGIEDGVKTARGVAKSGTVTRAAAVRSRRGRDLVLSAPRK